MNEKLTMILAILAVLLSVVAIMSGLGIKPVDVDTNTVGGNEIIDGSVTTDDISDNTIKSDDLNSDTTNYIIGMFKVPENGVSSDNIADKSITNDDLANDSVSGNEIVDESINTTDIMDGAITNEKLADDAIQWNDINGIPIEVLAAGYILSGGQVAYGYNVESATYNPSTTAYRLNLTGYNSGNKYVTVLSLYGNATYSQVGHSLYSPVIYLYNSTDHHVQSDFYFVTYQIN